jgi:hypothetical protein
MLLPIDDPPDQLFGLITHELTHIFEFDIIPQSLIRRSVPLWVNEGLSDYERGQWSPIDLMSVRDAAVADTVPKMSELEEYGNSNNPRLIYNLGHAVFEFIEAKYGKEGIRQFLFSLRKSVIGGGEDAYEEALRMKKDEFDQAFERYLKDRFKPFRDKERPADYGRDLAPNREKTEFADAFSIAPSPSGDLIAAATVNRKDRELDIVLISAKDGSIVRDLTRGFDKDMGFDHLVFLGERFEMPWMSWSPRGDRLAYFVRTRKERTLIVQNVLTRKLEQRIDMKSVDEPESPSFSPDGRTIAFAALRGAIGDIYTVDLSTGEITNLTDDSFADAAPSYSPDGKFIIYNKRVSGNQKLFRLDLDTKKKTQITFGTTDETAAQFLDDHTVVFSSTMTDPNVPLEPDVARNGNIYNIWTLDLRNGELRQYTDALGGNWSAVVLNEGQTNRVAFISYYKGEYSIHTLERKEPLHTAASSDFGAPGEITDFQAPLQHTLVAENKRKKGTFEKMFLEGRPPVNVGVTSGGDVFGGSQVSFGDVLGDQQFNLSAASIAQYKTIAFSYVNLSRRFQWALQGYSQTQFFYGNLGGLFYDPTLAPFISRDDALAAARRSASTRSIAITASSSPAASFSSRSSTTIRICRRTPISMRRSSPAGSSCSATARSSRSARRSCRRRRCSASSGRLPAAPCGSRTTTRPRSAAYCRARPSTATRATICGSDRTACSRLGFARSAAPAISPTSSTSAATRSSAATTTSSSPARTPCSRTPSCGSR